MVLRRWSLKQINDLKALTFASCTNEWEVRHHNYMYFYVHTLFFINLDGYNKYVEVVGSSIGAGACANLKRSGKISKIDDSTKMLHFLSEEKDVGEGNDWLYTVIKDIVSTLYIKAVAIRF